MIFVKVVLMVIFLVYIVKLDAYKCVIAILNCKEQ